MITETLPAEFKLVRLRECPIDDDLLDTPEKVVGYWRQHIPQAAWWNPDVESLVVFLLNSRRRIIGHHLVAMGLLDTLLAHPREVFRPAIIGAASAIVLAHNHPSGDATPSEADIKITRDLIKAGQLLKLELLDHVVVGQPGTETGKGWTSLRELGYFYL